MKHSPFQNPVSIFFDGKCRICAWETEEYLKRDRSGKLRAIDISSPSFDAQTHGLDPKRVQKYFHASTPEGKIVSGVDAFITIWEALGTPLSLRAARWARNPIIRAILTLGYTLFAQIRPYLPKKPNAPDCDDGSCDFR
jgi:predicted DCC family thiol-disulfide oxidoreductase YuxK